MIHRPSLTSPEWPQVFGVPFLEDDLVATMQAKSTPITKTGIYSFYFIPSHPNLKHLVIEGKTIWKSPTGLLPGIMALQMNFHGFMSAAFIVLRVFWFSQCARFWREVLPLQNSVTLTMTLSMFEDGITVL